MFNWQYDLVATIPSYRKWKWLPSISIYNRASILKEMQAANDREVYDILIRWGKMQIDLSVWKDK